MLQSRRKTKRDSWLGKKCLRIQRKGTTESEKMMTWRVKGLCSQVLGEEIAKTDHRTEVCADRIWALLRGP